MKHPAMTALAAAALLSLAACGGGDGEGADVSGDTMAVESVEPVAPPAIGPDTMAPAVGADTTAPMGADTAPADTGQTM